MPSDDLQAALDFVIVRVIDTTTVVAAHRFKIAFGCITQIDQIEHCDPGVKKRVVHHFGNELRITHETHIDQIISFGNKPCRRQTHLHDAVGGFFDPSS